MGVKERARAAMRDAGVPVLPGSEGVLKSVSEALDAASQVGYPVMIKASAGGGGRGMRVVASPADLPAQF
jgi:acetyl-CoA carboxylase biotin carboxylase subunit